jgi:hypothetical protein
MTAFVRWMLGHRLVQAELWYDYDDVASRGADYAISAFPRSAAILREAMQSPRFLDALAEPLHDPPGGTAVSLMDTAPAGGPRASRARPTWAPRRGR